MDEAYNFFIFADDTIFMLVSEDLFFFFPRIHVKMLTAAAETDPDIFTIFFLASFALTETWNCWHFCNTELLKLWRFLKSEPYFSVGAVFQNVNK